MSQAKRFVPLLALLFMALPGFAVAQSAPMPCTGAITCVSPTNCTATCSTATQPPLPLKVATTTLIPGTVGVQYQATLAASGGTPPYNTWTVLAGSITAGSLPPGLALDKTSGVISGTPAKAGADKFTVQVTDATSPPAMAKGDVSIVVADSGPPPPPPPPPPPGAVDCSTTNPLLDKYCGVKSLPSPNGATGYFRVEKDKNNRWWFVSPLGNYLWMRAAYNVTTSFLQTTPTNVLATKYAGNKAAWATHQNSRLLNWGFNALGEYAFLYALPVNTNGSKSNANPVKLPFILLTNAMVNMHVHPTLDGIAEAPKNMISGVPRGISVWRGSQMTDMFDPKVKAAYQADIKRQVTGTFTGGLDSPWILGITTDDTDYLFGLKNRGDSPFSPHPNVGFIAAVTNFNYSAVSGGPYLDAKLYTKYAWVDFLRAKYSTIAALNAAWGTGGFYTSFDDAGGYGAGTGVLDEDGSHAWIGKNALTLAGTSAAVATDMNAFVYKYAYQYASTAVAAIRTYDTHHLIFGPAALSAGGYEDRPQVLQAFSDAGIDVIQMSASITGDFSGHKATYDLIGKPIYLWYAVVANDDSGLHGYVSSGQGVKDYGTQAARGAQYAIDLKAFLAAQATNGDHYLLGIDWWEFTDGNFHEKTNWGLVSDRDNAYDGKEATSTSVKDSGGYTTVPEAGNYGNFIGPVTAANAGMSER